MMTQPPKGPRIQLVPGRGLIWQLLLITILPLTILTLVITFGSLALHQRAMRSLVGDRDQRAVRTAAAALEEQFKHRENEIRGLSLQIGAASQDELPGILSSSNYLLDEFTLGLATFNPNGSLVSSNGDQELWANLSEDIQPIINSLVSNPTPYLISTSLTEPDSGEKLVLFLALSPERNFVVGGASTAVDLVQHTLARSFGNGQATSVFLIDADKRLVVQEGLSNYQGEPAAHPGVAEALNGENGVTYVKVGNSEHVVTYSPISPVGWALVLEEPWEVVDTPTLRTTQLAPLVLVPVLLLTLVALWFVLRQVVRPLQALEAKAATLAWGDFQTIEESVGGINEIRRLQAELVHLARKVRVAQQGLHGYIGAITAGQEEERLRLARELHDDTLQSLIALKQRVQLAQLGMKDGSAKESLSEIVSLTDQTIENVRRQTRALRPIYLEDLGLVTALEMLTEEMSHVANIPVEFERQGVERRLDPDVELALYRIAQEALNNVARHAQATQAHLSISFTPQEVTLQAIDNGKGFEVPGSPAEFAPGGHFGLLGLSERAELIGARLEIHSSSGQGSRVIVHLPVQSEKV